uniref:NADH-ubiquinone oxidoreductase chain 2 n=1 Tax=Limnodrilus hoffmeisteri TaxID=76587 RepID=A0A8F2F9V2_9ANNE|nr:NADH dehydrogenase subunit 2 [Limnodrilus hoffmeisteri]
MFILPSSLLFSLLLLLSTIMALSSTNWLIAWISMEVNLLSFVPLMLQSHTNQETESAVKYFLAQALGSAIMLYSSMMLYNPSNQVLVQLMLVMSLLLKLGAAPCHYWFPSTMTSMSWLNCLILCTWQKLGPLALMIFPFIGANQLKPLLVLVAATNAILGGLLGMNQSHIRTILAYSSITHMGWTIGGFLTNTTLIPMLYFTMYSLIITPMFIMLNSWKSASPLQMPQMLMNSLSMSIMFSLTLLSLGGLPPLTGFIPKWMTIIMLSDINWVLIMLMLLGSLMNLYFYLNLVFNMLTSSMMLNSHDNSNNPVKLSMLLAAGLNSLGVFPMMMLLL